MLARPSLDRLRDDATKGSFDAVLLNDVDRLARDVAHLGIIKRGFESKHVQLVFRKLPSDNSPTYNLMVNILGSFAEFEREQILDRMRRGKRHKVEVRKQYVGCIAPYGYRYQVGSATVGREAQIEIISKEAEAVKKIYTWASAGISMKRIARNLDELGVPTRTGRPAWAASIVHRILHNETYAGVWSYCKLEACEPIRPKIRTTYRRISRSSRRRMRWNRLCGRPYGRLF